MHEETKIIDAETEKSEGTEEMKAAGEKAKRNDFYIELALFLILGVLIGIAVKTEASKKITIGFEDYKIKSANEYYNINILQNDLEEKMTAEAESVSDQADPQEQNEAQEGQGAEVENPEDNQ